MNNELAIFRLMTGEEVMGRFEPYTLTANRVTITDAFVVYRAYDEETSVPVLLLEKYCLGSNDFDVTFRAKDIISISKNPIDSLVRYYLRRVARTKSIYNGDDPSEIEEAIMEKETVTLQ